jgi:hypothetical protein
MQAQHHPPVKEQQKFGSHDSSSKVYKAVLYIQYIKYTLYKVYKVYKAVLYMSAFASWCKRQPTKGACWSFYHSSDTLLWKQLTLVIPSTNWQIAKITSGEQLNYRLSLTSMCTSGQDGGPLMAAAWCFACRQQIV